MNPTAARTSSATLLNQPMALGDALETQLAVSRATAARLGPYSVR
jgi:hypothetical protein